MQYYNLKFNKDTIFFKLCKIIINCFVKYEVLAYNINSWNEWVFFSFFFCLFCKLVWEISIIKMPKKWKKLWKTH